MNLKREQRRKTACNQKWRKQNGKWKHDLLPIFIIQGDDGLYQVRYRTPASWSQRIAKSASNRKWYALEVAKKLARKIEGEIQASWEVGAA
jgi:hypothetical protein